MKIFYSWQRDLPNAINRGFIRSALTDAVKQVAAELDIQYGGDPLSDEDTAEGRC